MNTIFSLGRYFYHFFIGELIKFRWGGSKFRWGLGSLKYRWRAGKIRWGPVSLGVLQRGVVLIDQNRHMVPGKVRTVSFKRDVFWPTDSVKDTKN